jgi:hypothetical protein
MATYELKVVSDKVTLGSRISCRNWSVFTVRTAHEGTWRRRGPGKTLYRHAFANEHYSNNVLLCLAGALYSTGFFFWAFFAAASSAMGTFRQFVESADLLAFQDRLLENGFDDIDALCDMTEDDMRTIGIPADRRRALQISF